MSLQTVTVTATYKNPDGSAVKGRVVFRLLTPIIDTNDNVLVPAGSVSVALDAQGSLSHALVPSDAAGIAPTPVVYTVTEQMPEGRTYEVFVPGANPTVRLSDLVPLAAPLPAPTDPTAITSANRRAAALSLIMGA